MGHRRCGSLSVFDLEATIAQHAILGFFELTEWIYLLEGDQVVQTFDSELTNIQQQVLSLLGLPRGAYRRAC